MKNTATHIFTKAGIAVAAVFLAAGANAATYTWDFVSVSGVPGSTISDTSSSCSGTGCATTPTLSLTLSAYKAANTTSATWSAATFNSYSGGLGISDTSVPQGSPEHAIDSITPGNVDYVVMDAGAGKTFDWTSLAIGWGYDTTIGAATCTGDTTTAPGTVCTPEIKLWSSNSLPGTLNGTNIAGFANSMISVPTSGATTTIPNAITNSRYLILSGDVNDAFKLKTLTAARVPEPASIALLALGLLGVGFSRRKSAR